MFNLRIIFLVSSRRRHTILLGDWSSDVCSSNLRAPSLTPPFGQRYNWRAPEQDSAARSRHAILNPAREWKGTLLHASTATDDSDRRPRVQIGRASCRERV